jgi:hypothetical protein
MELPTRLTKLLPDVEPSHKQQCPGQEQFNTVQAQTILKLHNILTQQLVLLRQHLHIHPITQQILATVVLPFQAHMILHRSTITNPMEEIPGITRRHPNTNRMRHMQIQNMPNQHLPIEVRQALHPGVVIVTGLMTMTGSAAATVRILHWT